MSGRVRGVDPEPADALLLDYAATFAALGSPPAQQIIARTAERLALFCSRDHCTGIPHEYADGWKCSVCRRPWRIEELRAAPPQWSRKRDRVRPRARGPGSVRRGETHLHVRLADLGLVLERVHRFAPWPFRAWVVHVLGIEPVGPAGPRAVRGLAVDQIGAALLALAREGSLERLPVCPSRACVECWIAIARRETMREHRRRRMGRRRANMAAEAYTLTVQHIAKRLGVDDSHVRRLVESGQLAAVDVSSTTDGPRELRFSEAAFADFVQRRTVRSRGRENASVGSGGSGGSGG